MDEKTLKDLQNAEQYVQSALKKNRENREKMAVENLVGSAEPQASTPSPTQQKDFDGLVMNITKQQENFTFVTKKLVEKIVALEKRIEALREK